MTADVGTEVVSRMCMEGDTFMHVQVSEAHTTTIKEEGTITEVLSAGSVVCTKHYKRSEVAELWAATTDFTYFIKQRYQKLFWFLVVVYHVNDFLKYMVSLFCWNLLNPP